VTRTARPQSRRTVLFIERYGVKGGAQVVLRDIVAGLDADRFRPIVVCLAPGDLVEELRALGATTYVSPIRKPARPRHVIDPLVDLAKLSLAWRKEQVDLVHVNQLGGKLPLLYGTVAAWLLRRPVVWHVYDPPDDTTTFASRILLALVARLHPRWTIFATPAAQAAYLAVCPHIYRHTLVVPGVDPPAHRAPHVGRATLCRRLGIPEWRPIVTMLARVTPPKGQEDLIRALAELSSRGVDAHAVICGGLGPERYREDLVELSRDLGVADRVTFTGYVSEETKQALLHRSNVYAHTARFEPFGLAVVEAMLEGKPVVAADAPGPAFLIEHGQNGLLYPGGNHLALAEALQQVLEDRALACRLGEGARRRAAEFAVDKMVSAVERVWADTLGGSPLSPDGSRASK
jgi:glycosyltransferase involved in cell wall biosynthesis